LDSDNGDDSINDDVFHSALDILEEQDRAKLDEYDAQIAEAWRIHNKYHPIADGQASSDSNSELSALASSIFNGMKDIERGRMEGIEMGGTIELQGESSGSATILGGNNKVKVSRYGRVLKKRTKDGWE
jgi:hypothetical protein